MKSVLIGVLCLLWGCQSAPEQNPKGDDTFPITFRVTDDEQIPVSGSIIRFNRNDLYVSATGIVTEALHGKEGDAFTAKVICPAGWNATHTDRKQLVLKKMNANIDAKTHALKMLFICTPEKKNHVLIVKSNQPRLPVQINGKTITHTNAEGFAQLVVAGKAKERVHLKIDTDEYPLLLPRNPDLVVSLPEKRKFLVFEQPFEHVKIAPRKRPRRTGPRRL